MNLLKKLNCWFNHKRAKLWDKKPYCTVCKKYVHNQADTATRASSLTLQLNFKEGGSGSGGGMGEDQDAFDYPKMFITN